MIGPLTGVRVVELSHMVMGPTCGMVLGDLGAEVIKVEPINGDKTRTLSGLGAGFFRSFNRNKQSIALDLEQPASQEVLKRLIASADIFCENFRPGRMQEIALDYATLSSKYPRLIYVSHKGFLAGPYEHRKALDEVVQMMAGLAYMTGPPGQPLRMGASVNDIMGGIFGALGAVSAILEREKTGKGQEIQSGLFENCAFLATQHMQQFAKTGIEPMPMPRRHVAWAIYEVFTAAQDEQLFIGVVSDGQWRSFCNMLGRDDWTKNPSLATNTGRVEARPWLMPELRELVSKLEAETLMHELDAAGIPYAPIARPQDLFNDRHLIESGGLGELVTETGETTRLPLLPFTLGGRRFGARHPLPKVGQDTPVVLRSLGYSDDQIDDLAKSGAIQSQLSDLKQ
ncbi:MULTISPECIES: CaiB/BaiF CoA-transferase family protein [Paraburkholderia]|uniref:CoA transferase n=1 Tax=Paraburkholderia dipogonis TaxID=1211383 RepID=A0A4Y8MGV1_9BURK|nr:MULTISPECIES: CaiB/BaiF CoA-transferase family protein [Paraburkholderia]RKR31368.1 crotonobetainyl-CoA:carnitine CoA-transferase CaiB-like acyl-CoA transferase [Paraburkholderia sp. BL17N1]TFE36671.1 CoA transferase [Paraburkholderia dipogonis]